LLLCSTGTSRAIARFDDFTSRDPSQQGRQGAIVPACVRHAPGYTRLGPRWRVTRRCVNRSRLRLRI